jgi:DNA-binding transcriptional LysR family regulator
LRYLVAVADAGTFTHAADRVSIAQPTLSQQIRRLEDIIGAPLLQRRREGVRLTPAGIILVQESRTVLSLLEHGVSRSRQAAGLGQPRLRFVVPPYMPEALAVEITSRLRSAAAAVGADVDWLEMPLDAQFTLIRQRQADAGVGWLAPGGQTLSDPLDVMSLAEFEPEVWVPSSAEISRGGTITLDELARMVVIHGPRRAGYDIHDEWLTILRTRQPRFEFTDPPFRRSLPMTLAFAATASRPTAVLTGPLHDIAGLQARGTHPRAADSYDMVRIDLKSRPLIAMAGLVWSGDLPRDLQQVLYETAASIPPRGPFAVAS